MPHIQPSKTHTLRRYIPVLILALVLLGAGGVLLHTLSGTPAAQKEDYRRIAEERYDTVFLSMYPIDTFQEELYSYFRGMTILKASYCIPDFTVLEKYMEQISLSGNTVTTAYLGLRPDKTDLTRLRELTEQYPSTTFEVVLSYPPADYWSGLSEKTYDQVLGAYCQLLTATPEMGNISFYFYASLEWLISNPANYIEDWLVNEDVANLLLAYSDHGHDYMVTAENAESLCDMLRATTQAARAMPAYPDLSGYCLIFFGDSVIGNYTDSTSIPGVTAALTGAEIINCGYGGNSAALDPEDEKVIITLPGVVKAFFQKDLSVVPEEAQAYKGISAYKENPPENKKLCFIINYGLNDYFHGYPLSSEDPYDITTYCGAIRTAVSTIRANAPEAQIILCAPTFCAYFQNGTDPHGDDGFVLEDYVNAVLALSEELNTDIMDNYHSLGITPDNWPQYLMEDQIHPNNGCRYLFGQKLIPLIR